MVKFLLSISADLENLTSLQPKYGSDENLFIAYYLKLKCGNCGTTSPKESCVSFDVTVPNPNDKGWVNLVQKCKFCGKVGTVSLIEGQGRPLTQELSDGNEYAPLMQFDCKGFEPVGFSFGDDWEAESPWSKFSDIDLSEGEFTEYDEDGKFPVSISNLRAKFEVVKSAALGYKRYQ